MFKEFSWSKHACFYSYECTQSNGTFNVSKHKLPKWLRDGCMGEGYIGKGNKWHVYY